MEWLVIVAKSFQIGEIKTLEIEFIYLFEAKTHYFVLMISFLKADWRKLSIANYEIDPAVLTKFIPAKTELDLWNGKCVCGREGHKHKGVCGVKFKTAYSPDKHLQIYCEECYLKEIY